MSEDTTQLPVVLQPSKSVLVRMGERYGIDPDKMLVALKATAFKGNVSNEQMMALLVVADHHGLNPWTREIFAFPSQQGIVPVVSVDGWAKIINSHPQFDGMDFQEAEDGSWIECSIYRKDRAHPTKVKEWMSECKRDTQPWKSHPRRMLRHKALIQGARIAFGFAGIFDHDEAERVVEAEAVQATSTASMGLNEDPDVVASYVKRYIEAMALDMEEIDIAEKVFDISKELYGKQDLVVAIHRELTKKASAAVRRYASMYEKARDAAPSLLDSSARQ